MVSHTSNFERLLKELRYGNDDQRKFAALELGSSGDSTAVPHLEWALDDPSPLVRVAAVVSLAKLGSLGSVPKLVCALESEGPLWANLRGCALESLLSGCRVSEDAERFGKLLAEGIGRLGAASPESRESLERIAQMAKRKTDALITSEVLEGRVKPPRRHAPEKGCADRRRSN